PDHALALQTTRYLLFELSKGIEPLQRHVTSFSNCPRALNHYTSPLLRFSASPLLRFSASPLLRSWSRAFRGLTAFCIFAPSRKLSRHFISELKRKIWSAPADAQD
ncbi:hypothetical protein LGM90_29195, partial [Burkholderia sp. AU28942]|nr:hypothetical protein [Burkholderia sp. AU28942]